MALEGGTLGNPDSYFPVFPERNRKAGEKVEFRDDVIACWSVLAERRRQTIRRRAIPGLCRQRSFVPKTCSPEAS